MKKTKNIDHCEAMEQFTRASASGRRRKPDGDRIMPGTIVNYRNTHRLLTIFSQEKEQRWEVDASLRLTVFGSRQGKTL